MDPVMSRPQARERQLSSHARRITGTFVAFALSFVGLIAMPQPAQAADDIVVPDANFKAVINSTIAATTGTTRAADQPITPADALKVTSVESYNDGTFGPVADFTGVAALTNLTTLNVYHTASTISLEPFAGSSVQSIALVPLDAGAEDFTGTISSDLSALGSMSSVNNVVLAYFSLPDAKLRTLPEIPTLEAFTAQYAGITDVSPVARLTNLNSLDLEGNRIRDLSPIAEMPNLRHLMAPHNQVSGIAFLAKMKVLNGLNLSGNRIEDISAIAPLADRTKYELNQTIDLSLNRVADLSPLAGFFGGPSVSTYDQSVYVGPYQDGGVPIKLRNWRGGTPSSVVPRDAGTYNGATDRLVSNDPAAPFMDVLSNAAQASQAWKVHFAEAPDRLAALRVNEVESNGDPVNGDWVELYNPSSRTVDLSGLVLADNDDNHKIVLPSGTTISAEGYRAIRTDDPAVSGQFGLGSADSARIYAPGTTDVATNPIDAHSWTSHATTTYGRTAPGAGTWATTSGGTFGTVNEFPPPMVIPTVAVTGDAVSTNGAAKLKATISKPDSTELAADATGTVVFSVGGKAVSGPVAVVGGMAEWTATGLEGSPSGTGHEVVARYTSSGDADPYDDSAPSAPFAVTVTIGDFAGAVTLSTTTPQVCQTITSDVSGVTPKPDAVTYQWQSNSGSGQSPWVNMTGETNAAQVLKYNVQGSSLVAPDRARRLIVTVSKPGYATKTFTSAETSAVEPAPFSTAPAASLSTSTPKVGETITATHPEWTTCVQPELSWKVGYKYQWLCDGEPISGAADAVSYGVDGAGPKQVAYTATRADAGHRISLRVTGFSTAIPDKIVISAETSAVAAGAFDSSPAPTIDNSSPKVGDRLTATTAAWSPSASMAYQWLRDGQPIAGATSTSHLATAADADHELSVRATGTAEGYASAEKTSATTAKVERLVFTDAPVPVINDVTPRVGDKLTATVGAWTPVASFTWEWLRDGQPITGATAATYTVAAADQGRTLSVRVTGAADGQVSSSRTSAVTARVVPKPPAPVKHVSTSVSSKYTVKVTADSGRKLRLSVTAKKVPTSAIDTVVRVKIAGVKGTYAVTVKNGKATFKLGSKAKKLTKGAKIKVTVTLAKLTASSLSTTGTTRTTTTYTVAKATKKVKVKLR